ncbi:MAG: aminotransferase class III-fold pyridoxal phosphate-dependent enzyme [Myxococcales bacterium]|nr:aminotransferase class III-fold pyridoxal phosphate-dependent enzyme [Myxococcales bacterium]
MTVRDYFYTWNAQAAVEGSELAFGEGAELVMRDGTRWLDMGSLSYQASLGQGHASMRGAIAAQTNRLCLAPPNADFAAKSDLAAKLLSLAPEGYSKVFFTLGGAEANENAMKIARLVTGRIKFLSRYRSYHGATLGALALTGDYRRPPLEPAVPGVVHILGDDPGVLEATMVLEGPGSIAAVFMEPIPGANGVIIPRKDYWPRMRAACDAHETLLVADEVLTGFGRTGRCFGFEHEGVVPDMITVAKALTAGYAPLGAVLVHERVAQHFEHEVLYAGLTNYAHPIGCAAALAALTVYEEEGLYARAAQLESTLQGGLEDICKAHPAVASRVRGRGLLAAIDISGDQSFWERLLPRLAAQRVLLHISERRGTAILAPALNMSEQQMSDGLGRIASAITEATVGG